LTICIPEGGVVRLSWGCCCCCSLLLLVLVLSSAAIVLPLGCEGSALPERSCCCCVLQE